MTTREASDVIKGFNCCNLSYGQYTYCYQCPYAAFDEEGRVIPSHDCSAIMIDDINQLLESEKVKFMVTSIGGAVFGLAIGV